MRYYELSNDLKDVYIHIETKERVHYLYKEKMNIFYRVEKTKQVIRVGRIKFKRTYQRCIVE